jgi:hypothetical protein
MLGFRNDTTRDRSWQDTDTGKMAVLKTLAYFDIFHYPLTRDEIRQFLDHPVTEYELANNLNRLVDEGYLFLHAQFYSLHNTAINSYRRVIANERASILLPKAIRIGRFLQQFPFVRGIGISGSLSKNVAEDESDIDFFIITKANRLWIARTIMHLFKKLTFLTGKQHFFCMNYYIDEKGIKLAEQNIFTAIELKTLLPVCGALCFDQFFRSNEWADEWLPSCPFRQQSKPDKRVGFLKMFTEWLLDNSIGNRLDNWLMHITSKRWKKKEMDGNVNMKGLRMILLTGKHFARSNSGRFQEKVLATYESKLKGLGVV